MTGPASDIDAALQRANALFDLGRFGEAAALASQVISREPNLPGAWCLLARAYLGEGENKKALLAAQTAIRQGPEDDWPLRLANLALVKLGRTDEAIDAATRAVKAAPHNWQTHVRLAYTLTAAPGRTGEALAAAERAVALAPDRAETHLAIGAAAAADKQREKAEAAFRRALAIDPQSTAAHNALAALHVRKRSATSLARAAGGFATAVAIDPRFNTGRRNVDLAMRRFIGFFSYLVFVDAYLLARVTSSSSHAAGRAVPILALALPGAYAIRFVLHLSPPLRQYLLRLVLGPGPIRSAAAAEAGAIVFLLAGAFATQHSRPTLSLLAAMAALAARIFIYRARRRAQAAAGRNPA